MQINGKELAVEIDGDGTPIVLVHGLGATTSYYQPQADTLAGRHRVVRFDLHGHGRSPLSGAISIGGFVDDLAALLDALDLDATGLVGHSMGTLVVREFAARHPERVSALALLGAVRAPTDAGRQAQHDRAATAREWGMGAVAPGIVAAATSRTTREQRPEQAAFVRELLLRQDPESYARACEALAAAGEPDDGGLLAPVLLVTGSDDGVGPPQASQDLAAGYRAASTAVYDGVGHWTPIEAASAVCDDLLKFFE